jgi:anthranilate synthase component I
VIPFLEFEGLAQSANVIPLTRSLVADLHTPVSTYLALREGTSASFLFESVEQNEKVGRYSFIGLHPVDILRARDRSGARALHHSIPPGTNIFDASASLLSGYRCAAADGLHGFTGGLVGYIGYPNVSHLERIPYNPPGPDDEDDAILGLFPTVVRFDHRNQVMTLIHNVLVDPSRPLREQYEEGRKILETIDLRLRRAVMPSHNFACTLPTSVDGPDRERFLASVNKAKEHIVNGDIFQVVLSRRVSVPFSGDPFPVYRALRMVNPSPYLFMLDFGETKLIGSSPEVLLRVRNGTGELFPIAGTRKRGVTEEEDAGLAKELLADEKELAEHVMLVDLGRNDLGRVSAYGSVSVPVLKRIERYSHVMHIVSSVTGRLRPEVSALDALRACFPAGTVSGAPKVRAMQLIHELEAVRRGAYAGGVGYVGFNGDLDTCIAIRTIVAFREKLKIQTGAGIVADSVPASEYEETVNKSRAMLEAIRLAGEGLQQ